MEQSIRFAHKLKLKGADHFYFSIAQPLYGTELYEQAIKGGFLKKQISDDELCGGGSLIETPEFTVDDLCHFCARGNALNPTFTFRKFREGIQDPTKVIKFILCKIESKKKAKQLQANNSTK